MEVNARPESQPAAARLIVLLTDRVSEASFVGFARQLVRRAAEMGYRVVIGSTELTTTFRDMDPVAYIVVLRQTGGLDLLIGEGKPVYKIGVDDVGVGDAGVGDEMVGDVLRRIDGVGVMTKPIPSVVSSTMNRRYLLPLILFVVFGFGPHRGVGGTDPLGKGVGSRGEGVVVGRGGVVVEGKVAGARRGGGVVVAGEKGTFIHPGILLSAADLDHIRAVARDHRMPEYGSFELLRDNPLASAGYKMKGPFRTISRDGDYSYTKSSFEADFSAAWLNTLMWVATGDSAHARRALDILGAYADSLTTIPSTNDAPLLAGLEGMKIVNVMEILRYTYKNIPAATTGKINRMIVGVFMPVCQKFYDTSAYTNGNWGPIVTRTWMSAAIYFDNRTMYKKAVDFYYNAHDNGTIRNYISGATGQIQESGRDQGHPQLGLGALATVCQIAWNQGDDLYSALDNRLLRGFEYVAKYNLGFDDVPFVTWRDVTGKYCDWTVISTKSRGHFIPVYEMVYNHFVRMEGLEMPYTRQVLEKLRPEGYDRDQPGFGTLLYYGTRGTKGTGTTLGTSGRGAE